MGELEVIADGRRFVFPSTATVRIGRDPEADVVIPLATVGRLHGHVTFAEGQWTFYDDASRNGTWLGDTRVDRVPIAGPTTLRLGGREGGGDLILRPAPDPAGPPDGANGDAATSAGPAPSAIPAGDRPPAPPPPPPAVGTPAVGPPAVGAPPVGVPAGGPPAVGMPPVGPPPVAPPPVGPPPVGPPPVAPPPVAPPPVGPPPVAPPPVGGAVPPAGIPRVPGGPIMPPAMGAQGPAGGTLMAHSQSGAPVLVARLGTKQYLFPVGASIRIGREPGLEMVSDNPLVSRNYHALLTSDPGGATFTDASSRGSFLDGKRITGPLRITESVTIRLGDPATGEELGVTPPLSADQIEQHRRRRQASRRLKTAVGIGALIVLVIAVVVVVVKVSNRGTTASSLTVARQATVLLLQGTPADAPGAGSGTIISPDGLILTNGHVAEPQAPGEAVSLGAPGQQLQSNPPFLTVEVYAGESSPVVPKYRAKVVSVDGYLDLAVVRIYATASGAPIAASSLHLPYLHIGDVATLQLDQHVRVLGFPGVSQSNSLTITDGVISTFVPDPLGHVHDNRFELETTARVAHGNSGGAAIDDHGDLIGVPSLTIPGEGGDISWRLRSVAEGIPLIDAALTGRPYVSHWLVARNGREGLTATGIGATGDAACSGSSSAASGQAQLSFGFSVTNVPAGLDYALLIAQPDGTLVQDVHGAIPEAVFPSPGGSGCYAITVPAGLVNDQTWPDGTYQVQLLIGPNLDPLGPAAPLTVGSGTSAPSGGGGT